MSLTEILLLGILIMQVIIFHYGASSSGRYMKCYDAIAHRLIKYLGQKTKTTRCSSGHQLAKGYQCFRIYLGRIIWQMRKIDLKITRFKRYLTVSLMRIITSWRPAKNDR